MFERQRYLDKLIEYKDTEFIKVITGVRRSGKSYVLHAFQKYLLSININDDQIFYYNFEAPMYMDLLNYRSLYQEIKERAVKDQKIYFLFDEIQLVDEWQKLINGLRVEFDADIYITGSNASLLSGELATYLSGRYIEIPIFPLSFKEYLQFREVDDFREYLNEYREFLATGGFPSVVLQTSVALKQDILQGIFDSVILKDVNLRSVIREPETLVKIATFLMSNIGQLVSINKITNTLKSNGVKTTNRTIENYLKLLEDSFLFYKARRYDIRGKEYLTTNAKYYCVDVGLRNSSIRRINSDYGSQLENLVYLELRRRGYQVFVGKFNSKEIDFVAIKNGITEYYQVAQQIPENSTRETDNLLHLPDNHKKTLITETYTKSGAIEGIEVLNIIDFLLEDE
jgi:Predicted ATPase (AAA+ superfamily)